jgi:hypothetical protein
MVASVRKTQICRNWMSLPVLLLFSACNNIGPAGQFGQSVKTVVAAENYFFDGIEKKRSDVYDLNLVGQGRIQIGSDGGPTNREASRFAGNALSPDSQKALNSILTPLTAYGQALQDIAGTSATAVTNFNSNADALAKSAIAVDNSIISPLAGGGAVLSTSQVTDLTSAVKSLGDIVIKLIINKDIRAAAVESQPNISLIAKYLKIINDSWSDEASQLSTSIRTLSAVQANMPQSPADRYSIIQRWRSDVRTPVSSNSVNAALDKMLLANKAMATQGIDVDTTIKSIGEAESAAFSAYTAYKSVFDK